MTTDQLEASLYRAVVGLAKDEMTTVDIISPKIAEIALDDGMEIVPDHFLAGAPSVLFDFIIVAPAKKHAKSLAADAAAIDWIRDAFAHLKVIGFNQASSIMFEKASIAMDSDEGLVDISVADMKIFAAAAKKHRIWDREPRLRP